MIMLNKVLFNSWIYFLKIYFLFHKDLIENSNFRLKLACLPMARETWVQSQVESYQRLKKWYLMPPCLTLGIIIYGSRIKWVSPGKGVLPTLCCSSYRKGSLQVTLDYGRQLYFIYYV